MDSLPTHPSSVKPRRNWKVRIDLTGQPYGRWTVIGPADPPVRKGYAWWRCRCACGTEKDVNGTTLRFGDSKSCGCLKSDMTTARVRKHNQTGTGVYQIWQAMLRRCRNPRTAEYKYYGARGIAVCARWTNSFEAFLADMGARPEGTSLDRVDNNGNYCPENCRWATRAEQNANRRNSQLLTCGNRTQTIGAWARELGVSWVGLHARLARGMSAEEAITTPFRKTKRQPRRCEHPGCERPPVAKGLCGNHYSDKWRKRV